MNKVLKNKVLAVVVCACLLVMYLFSLFFVAEHLNHNCNGAHCEVCVHVSAAKRLLTQGTTGTAAALLAAAFISACLLLRGLCRIVPLGATLNELKIRLDI